MKRFSGNVVAPALVFTLCSLLALLGGCMNSENPDLLNAPLAEESIRVRLLNLAGDGRERELLLEGTRRIEAVPFAGLSAPVSSPADSVQATILSNGTQEYSTPYKIRFSRNALFTFVALPSADRSAAVDTLLVLSAPDSASPRLNNISYLRFINAFPGPDGRFSLRLGCPNGTVLASQVGYLGSGARTEMDAGTYTISLLKQGGTGDSVIGYYSVTIGANSDYTVFLYDAGANTPHLLLLHDRGTDGAALQQLPTVSASQAEVRVLNFSSQAVDISKIIRDQPDEVISQGVAPQTAGVYADVSACTSSSEDTLKIGGTPHFVGLSLEVLKRYTIVTIDSGESGAANFSVVVPPSGAGSSDSATIRVANLAWGVPALEISLGARTTVQNAYVTGQVLAPALEFAEISAPVLSAAGPAPFAVFSNAPKQLRAAAYAPALQPGGRYLLVITRSGDRLRLTLFDEDNPTARPIEALEEGVFTQVLNAVPDTETTQFSFGGVITNRALFYGSAAATVLPAGSHTLTAGGTSQNIVLEKNKRTLVLISGAASNPDITAFTTDPIGALPSDIRRRFLNASPTLPALTVKLDYEGGSIFANKLPYLGLSPVDISTQARKITLVFMDGTTDETLLVRNNIPFSLGQNFTIVLMGNAPNYRVVLLQEF